MEEGDLYRAVVNIDFTATYRNGYQRLMKALNGAGWEYVETSAMAYEGPLPGVLLGLEVLARAAPTGGTLSALTVQVQLMGPPKPTPGAARPQNALSAVLRMTLPSEMATEP